jgi:hypothetical protein
MVLGRRGRETPFAAALCASIPDVVRRHIPRSVIMAARVAAWQQVTIPDDDPRRTLESVRDPLRRALLAVTLPLLKKTWRGEALCGAMAELKAHQAEILAWHLLPRLLSAPLVPAYAVETVAGLVQRIADGGHAVRGWGTAQEWVRLVRAEIARSRLGDTEAEYVFAVMVRSFPPPVGMSGAGVQQAWQGHLQECLDTWRTCASSLGAPPERAEREAAELDAA